MERHRGDAELVFRHGPHGKRVVARKSLERKSCPFARENFPDADATRAFLRRYKINLNPPLPAP
jgi:hypothetical protein